MLPHNVSPPAADPQAETVCLVPEEDGIVALRMRGDIDLIIAPRLMEQADDALEQSNHVILDLSDATFVDSSAIHALLTVRAAASRRGCVTVLQIGPSTVIERALEITGIDRLIPRVGSRAEAVETIRQLAADGNS